MRIARRRRRRPLAVLLAVNVGLMACVLVALLSRGPSWATPANAAGPMPAISGGNGLYLMPGQTSQNTWGCYLLDTEKQTLVTYEYVGGAKRLQLIAARDLKYDRELRNFNTTPSPDEVRKIVELGKSGVRGQEKPPEGGQGGNEALPPAAGESAPPAN